MNLKIVDPNNVQLMGPYECPHCGYHMCIDFTFDDQISDTISCPGCGGFVEVPQNEEPQFIVKFEPAKATTTSKPKVVICVDGGSVTSVRSTIPDIEVVLFDRDNEIEFKTSTELDLLWELEYEREYPHEIEF